MIVYHVTESALGAGRDQFNHRLAAENRGSTDLLRRRCCCFPKFTLSCTGMNTTMITISSKIEMLRWRHRKMLGICPY
jgi:hypothetical protein